MPSKTRKATLLLALPLVLILSACGNSRLEAIKPPPEKLACADEPIVPAGDVTDAMVADYMLAQREAWWDCKTRIDWLWDFFAKLP